MTIVVVSLCIHLASTSLIINYIQSANGWWVREANTTATKLTNGHIRCISIDFIERALQKAHVQRLYIQLTYARTTTISIVDLPPLFIPADWCWYAERSSAPLKIVLHQYIHIIWLCHSNRANQKHIQTVLEQIQLLKQIERETRKIIDTEVRNASVKPTRSAMGAAPYKSRNSRAIRIM